MGTEGAVFLPVPGLEEEFYRAGAQTVRGGHSVAGLGICREHNKAGY